ncbi:iron chaperone [Saccharopolyspora dendranthemae]|uniref:Uncharacterized protein YdhG (YjbR/CyaY superfamily) n=1 Tax=Saccharopolyspora dendranthemae TaxID=1181886 RepID=A0A561U665_9PSEU|nr:DUF1801 domain-containing protein [Saccharopolyspora dendranthemae]TWF94859.1 uncharacterized protein YdhG (YjbR/CyaY superfamily) [Saccharopolyspora dendranthemae]
MSDHAAYIAEAAESLRPLLEQVRAQLSASLPDADEVMKYNMPGFQVRGSIVAGYAAFSRQCGLYLSPGAITALADDIAAAGLKASKTGVTFSARKPIPDDLVRQLAQASRTDLGV